MSCMFSCWRCPRASRHSAHDTASDLSCWYSSLCRIKWSVDDSARSSQSWIGLQVRKAKTPEENKTIKRVLQYVRLKSVGSVLKHARIPSPHWRQRLKSHSDAIEITINKLASLDSDRLRGVIMAATRKTKHLLWHHDNTTDAPSSYLATSDFKMATSLI